MILAKTPRYSYKLKLVGIGRRRNDLSQRDVFVLKNGVRAILELVSLQKSDEVLMPDPLQHVKFLDLLRSEHGGEQPVIKAM